MSASARGGAPAPLRFLYVHPVSMPGVEANLVQTAETCRALADLGHEVFLIVPKVKAESAHAALERLAVAPHENLFLVAEPSVKLTDSSGLASVAVRARLLLWLRSLVQRGRTVLYFRTLRDSRLARFLLLAGRVLRVPVLYEAHKLYGEKRADQGFGAATLARVDRLERAVLGRAAGVIASHPLLADAIRRGARPAGELLTAPNGVPERAPAAGAKLYDAAYAGSLFPWKGVDVVLDAVAGLPGCRLLLAGGNPEERLAELRARAAALGIAGRVQFAGQVPRPRALELVAAARCAVIPLDPAFGEGERYTCPLKMLEAMMLGVPVVAADTPALRTFAGGGESALFFPRGDAAALAAAIGRVTADPALAETLAAGGRAVALGLTARARARAIAEFAAALT